jgi:glutathione S-transferase
MNYVAIVTVVALLQFQLYGYLVGGARKRHGVAAPATSGHPQFERYFRVHANTLEQLMVFLPSMWIFAWLASPEWAAGIGAVFVVGRVLYFRSYIREPKSRSLGFALTALPSLVLMIGILWVAIGRLVTGP